MTTKLSQILVLGVFLAHIPALAATPETTVDEVVVVGSDTFKTSIGAVFVRAEGPPGFGKGWKDPSGAIWSSIQGEFPNNALQPDQVGYNGFGVITESPATQACEKIGGKLPSNEEFERFTSYFEKVSGSIEFSSHGIEDASVILPEAHLRRFWSSTISTHGETAHTPYSFFGRFGFVLPLKIQYRSEPRFVVCIFDENQSDQTLERNAEKTRL